MICDPRKRAAGSFSSRAGSERDRPGRRLFPLDNAEPLGRAFTRALNSPTSVASLRPERVICGSPLSPVFIPDYCHMLSRDERRGVYFECRRLKMEKR